MSNDTRARHVKSCKEPGISRLRRRENHSLSLGNTARQPEKTETIGLQCSYLALVLVGVLHRRHHQVCPPPAIHQVRHPRPVAAPDEPRDPQVLARGQRVSVIWHRSLAGSWQRWRGRPAGVRPGNGIVGHRGVMEKRERCNNKDEYVLRAGDGRSYGVRGSSGSEKYGMLRDIEQKRHPNLSVPAYHC